MLRYSYTNYKYSGEKTDFKTEAKNAQRQVGSSVDSRSCHSAYPSFR